MESRPVRLFRCETIPQYKIMLWLGEMGITPDDIAYVRLLDRYRVKVVNPAGGYMIVCWGKDGGKEGAFIDTMPEDKF